MLLYWVALGSALVGTAFGQTYYKLYFLSKLRYHLVAAVAAFVLATACNYVALQRIGIGTVYMSTALTHVLILVLARVVLHERLTREHVIAGSLILAGLALYSI